jgi:osmoprotectant transport system substrate-binding protein
MIFAVEPEAENVSLPSPSQSRDPRPALRTTRVLAVAAAALAAAPLLTACGGGGSGSDPLGGHKASGGTVVVGSNNFAESILLGDIYGEALKAKGVKVKYQPNIGSRETTYKLIKSGSLTLIPEYNGALLAYLDPKATPKTADATDAAITAKLPSSLEVLKHSGAEDKDSITVNSATAAKYHLTASSSIADLAKVASHITLGASPEFQKRQQGLLGLKSVYDLTPKSFKALDAGGPLTESALKKNNVQAADIFTTDPTISKAHFTVLTDPKGLFGYQNVLPLVHKSSLPAKAVPVLNSVSAKLTTEQLRTLDAEVSTAHKDPLDVARTWLTSVGLR